GGLARERRLPVLADHSSDVTARDRPILDLSVYIGFNDCFKLVEFGKAVDELPNLFRSSPEIMRSISMDPHAARMLVVVNVPAQVSAPLNHHHVAPRVGQHPCDGSTRQPGTHNDVIGAKRGAV